jgi:DNA sulfur modification protein DndD
MLLERLILEDVGTYSGRQVFELTPRKRYGAKKPVILFGGLNGAGKTTFLTAVRLALYGRQSTDSGATQKQYERYLRELIHRPKHALVRADRAAISLEFVYARFGVQDRYKILRSWEERGSNSVEEKLQLFRTGQVDEQLVDEQAQAFLNQMIPAGVAQFFFFDGEKIAALAKDDSDAVLADAIRRLLGLDLADRLSSDLNVYLRNLRANRADSEIRRELMELQAKLDAANAEVETGEQKLANELTPALDAARNDYEQKRIDLSTNGGAWAVDRGQLEAKLDLLRDERTALEDRLREQLGGIAIFSLAKKTAPKILASLELEQKTFEEQALSRAVSNHVESLKARIATLDGLRANQSKLIKCIDSWAKELAPTPSKGTKSNVVRHGLAGSDSRSVTEALTRATPIASAEVIANHGRATTIAGEEDQIHSTLAHAPSEDSIRQAFDAMSAAAAVVAKLEIERRVFIEDLRRKTWACIDLVRKLKKLEARVIEDAGVEKGEAAAEALQSMIVDFNSMAAQEKCETLRRFFVSAFRRLSRKEDIVHDARIDALDFSVTLLDHAGRDVPKKRLSAGEKQIYAIAMLEALAKASGRNLPIIIDTPLGRLDSKHRAKLVDAYFPIASHQVVLLSTDTEVDLPFYLGLQKSISHAYHLSFDSDEGATHVEEGYFWKNDEGFAHAS